MLVGAKELRCPICTTKGTLKNRNEKRSEIMGDKGGKKDKRKSQKQNNEKQKQKRKIKLEKQQKENSTLLLPK
jgi:predicted alpha/beta superfamily hydrolase